MLDGPEDAAIPLTAPHAVISGWLDDPACGGPEHGPVPVPGPGPRSEHNGPVKRWACGPPRPVTGTGLSLQVRLLDDNLAGRLISAATPGAPVRLGSGHYEVHSPARLAAQADWPELRHWPGTRAWQVRFLSPACARRRNRTSPLLAPDTLARGLADRWRALDPVTAPELTWRGTGPVWISDLDGHSQVQTLSRRVSQHGGTQPPRREEIISGFTGRVRYVCDGTSTEAACFAALLAFGRFAGVGSHTSYGFGTIVAEFTWQPPSVRTSVRG
jgi:hypothetical protein